jgi:hypothetical protein
MKAWIRLKNGKRKQVDGFKTESRNVAITEAYDGEGYVFTHIPTGIMVSRKNYRTLREARNEEAKVLKELRVYIKQNKELIKKIPKII